MTRSTRSQTHWFLLAGLLGLVSAVSVRAQAQDPPAANPAAQPATQPATEEAAPELDPAQVDDPAAAPAEDEMTTEMAPEDATETPVEAAEPATGFQLELGVFGGVNWLGSDLELGVPDAPGRVSSPDRPAGQFGLRIGVNYLPWIGVEAAVSGIPTEDRLQGFDAFLVSYQGNVLLYLLHGKIRPFVLAGGGLMQLASTDGSASPPQGLWYTDTDGEGHVGVGVKADVNDWLALRLDGQVMWLPNFRDGSYTANFALFGGLAFKIGPAKKEEPPPPPPPPVDTDGDGFTDDVDACPNEPEDADGFEDEDGCPDPDNDGDGVPDTSDQCPNEAETVNQIDDEDGCPEIDKDGDGIVGSKDKCPDEAEDMDGFEDEDGCPDPDNDGDGVPDVSDKCPTELETKNGFQDTDGCPDEIPAAIKKFTGVIKGIQFKKDSAEIRKSSFKILGDAVKVLKEYPDLRIEISGHTSSEGERDYNMKLSQERADSVKEFIVVAGVDAARIDAKGYGPDNPIAPNATRRGREQNRRIEFKLVAAP